MVRFSQITIGYFYKYIFWAHYCVARYSQPRCIPHTISVSAFRAPLAYEQCASAHMFYGHALYGYTLSRSATYFMFPLLMRYHERCAIFMPDRLRQGCAGRELRSLQPDLPFPDASIAWPAMQRQSLRPNLYRSLIRQYC